MVFLIGWRTRYGQEPLTARGTIRNCHNVAYNRVVMSIPDPAEELRRLYPPILTTAQVAEMMHCTIGDVRDKVHRREVPALRWGQQFRFFHDEVIAAMIRVAGDEPDLDNGDLPDDTGGDKP
ncbi:MAG: helix-turn-helix domain-containing protein [Actinobacteria bacterium]|nr:helix-turn-helix domain-containing protein [Actinomycetota bacterium]